MIFAINEINKSLDILPNIKLGYKIYGNCGTMDILRAALALVSGLKEEISDDSCTKTETVQAILGHSGSRPTIAFAKVVGRFQIPVVSEKLRVTEVSLTQCVKCAVGIIYFLIIWNCGMSLNC